MQCYKSELSYLQRGVAGEIVRSKDYRRDSLLARVQRWNLLVELFLCVQRSTWQVTLSVGQRAYSVLSTTR